MKSYGLDYVAGSNARKLEYDYEPEKKVVKKTSVKKQENRQVEVSKHVKVRTMMAILTVFSAFMIVIYRYNMISEANLKAIGLKEELEKVSSELSIAMMNVEQGTNLTEIEDYAKQKLGMQKPDKNQIVYVDTSSVNEVSVQSNEVVTSSILDSIKKFFSVKNK